MENEKQISVDPLLGSIILNAHILDYPTQRAFTTRLLEPVQNLYKREKMGYNKGKNRR